MTHNDEFDQVLGQALAEYRNAEPLAGLEDRVLQRLRLQIGRRSNLWWRWSTITAVAAALAFVAWIGLSHRVRPEVLPSSAVQKQAPTEPQPRTGDTRVANEQPTGKRKPGTKTVPKTARVLDAAQLASTEHAPMRERFPSPAPLKPEERMLLALATTHPEILMNKPDEDGEIVIGPIDIKPLVAETHSYQGEN